MTNRKNMPLAGVTVLDFGQVYQGPYATLLMATAGADVIKIEPPQGEPLRRRARDGRLTRGGRAIDCNLEYAASGDRPHAFAISSILLPNGSAT